MSVQSVFIVFCVAVLNRPSSMSKRWRFFLPQTVFTAAFGMMVLRGAVSLPILELWQAPGTGLHGNGNAHAAASNGHVGDVFPFVSVRAVTLNAGQEALLVETPCEPADIWKTTSKHQGALCNF